MSHSYKAWGFFPRYKPYLTLFSLALVTVTLFLTPLLFSEYNYSGSGMDINTYQFPNRNFAYSWLRKGVWPLWNPYIFGGVPYQTGVHPLAYPANILGLLMPTELEIKVTVWLHLMLALFFMEIMLYSLKYSIMSSYFGGLIYSLSGFSISHIYAGHIDIITTSAYFPLVFLATFYAIRRGGLSWSILAGLVTGLMILTGHYHISYLVLFGVWFFTLLQILLGSSYGVPPLNLRRPWNMDETDRDKTEGLPVFKPLSIQKIPWKERRKDLTRCLIRMAFIITVSIMITSFQFLPTLKSIQLSNRAGFQGFEYAVSFGVPKINWITYLTPGIFGGGEIQYWAPWAVWEADGYLGVISLFLIGTALVICSRREWLPHLIVIIFCTVLAMGQYTPLFKLYYYIDPMVGRLRAPSRFILPVTFFCAWLSALGFQNIQSADIIKKRKATLVVVFITVMFSIPFLCLKYTDSSINSLWYNFIKKIVTPETWISICENKSLSLERLLGHARTICNFGFVLAFISCATLLIRLFTNRGKQYISGCLIAIIIIDLFNFTRPYLVTDKASMSQFPQSTVEFLSKNMGVQRMITDPRLEAVNWGAAHGLSHIGGYDTLVNADYIKMADIAMGDYHQEFKLTMTTLFNYGPFWDINGVSYLLMAHPLESLPRIYREKFANFHYMASPGGIHIYKNPKAFPRAFLVHEIQKVTDQKHSMRLMAENRYIFRNKAIFYEEPDYNRTQNELDAYQKESPDVPGDDEEVNITHFSPNRVEISANLSRPGILVLTDAPWPGWKASVNGKEKKILAINGRMHRGVILPSGKHRIVFSYWPSELTIGIFISIITLILPCLCFFFHESHFHCLG